MTHRVQLLGEVETEATVEAGGSFEVRDDHSDDIELWHVPILARDA
jgi:hypothetical protein